MPTKITGEHVPRIPQRDLGVTAEAQSLTDAAITAVLVELGSTPDDHVNTQMGIDTREAHTAETRDPTRLRSRERMSRWTDPFLCAADRRLWRSSRSSSPAHHTNRKRPPGPTSATQLAPAQQTNRVPSFSLRQISINPPTQEAGSDSTGDLQRQPDSDRKRPAVGPEGGALDTALGERINAASGGEAFDGSTRSSMEPLFSHDFSNVRIYHDSEADQLSRKLGATAFTTGNDIFFRSGAYSPSSQSGQQLIAHELTHVVQQEGFAPTPGAPLTVGAVDDAAEAEAEQAAEAVTADIQDGQIERRSTRPSSVSRVIQRAPDAVPAPAAAPAGPTTAPAPAPTTTPAAPTTVTAANVEQLGAGLQARQTHLGNFLTQAQTDISNIRGYFKWVNDVYDRCYEHYELVLKQAKKQADTQQAWMDFISGVITGVAIGVIADAIPFLQATEGIAKVLSEAAAGSTSGGIGALTKTNAPALTPPIELNPAFKKVVSLQQLDKLNTEVLSLAVPGTLVFSNPLVQIERSKLSYASRRLVGSVNSRTTTSRRSTPIYWPSTARAPNWTRPSSRWS